MGRGGSGVSSKRRGWVAVSGKAREIGSARQRSTGHFVAEVGRRLTACVPQVKSFNISFHGHDPS